MLVASDGEVITTLFERSDEATDVSSSLAEVVARGGAHNRDNMVDFRVGDFIARGLGGVRRGIGVGMTVVNIGNIIERGIRSLLQRF